MTTYAARLALALACLVRDLDAWAEASAVVHGERIKGKPVSPPALVHEHACRGLGRT